METKEKITYKVQIAYRVWDYVDVTLDADQNPNDAIEIAEDISFKRSLNEMNCDHDYTEIIERSAPNPNQVFERCPHCETESGYDADSMMHICPICGKVIVMCSMCEETTGCANCYWVKLARDMNNSKAKNNETKSV
jgi:predicted RNA-binding Zn-ribbon protein involved in translation (DUF1610 family)